MGRFWQRAHEQWEPLARVWPSKAALRQWPPHYSARQLETILGGGRRVNGRAPGSQAAEREPRGQAFGAPIVRRRPLGGTERPTADVCRLTTTMNRLRNPVASHLNAKLTTMEAASREWGLTSRLMSCIKFDFAVASERRLLSGLGRAADWPTAEVAAGNWKCRPLDVFV